MIDYERMVCSIDSSVGTRRNIRVSQGAAGASAGIYVQVALFLCSSELPKRHHALRSTRGLDDEQ